MYPLRALAAIIILPFTVIVIIPSTLVSLTHPTLAWTLPPLLAAPLTLLAVTLAAIGLALIITTVNHFTRLGRGTLAPWDPPKRLVIVGPYRYVRNPMYAGVLFLLLAESVAFRSWAVFLWFAFFLTANLIYVPLSEEPGLIARFGDAYREYQRYVPPWIPRLTPWTPQQTATDEPPATSGF